MKDTSDAVLPGVTVLQGGVATGSTLYDTCDIRANLPEIAPTNPYCRYSTAFLTNVKFLASYTIPRVAVLMSGTFRSVPGAEILANYTASNAVITPSLGRPLAGTTANVVVNPVEPGSIYGERLNQIDLRLGKILRLGRMKTKVNLDIYDVFNANTILTVNNAHAAWRRPTSILLARFLTVSSQFDF